MLPTSLSLGGKAPQGGWPKSGWGGATCGEESSFDSNSPVGRIPFGSRSPRGTPTPLGRPRRPPVLLYNEGQGWGHSNNSPLRPPCPGFARCSTLDLDLDSVLD